MKSQRGHIESMLIRNTVIQINKYLKIYGSSALCSEGHKAFKPISVLFDIKKISTSLSGILAG